MARGARPRRGRRRPARGRHRDARARVDHGALRRQPDARHDLSRGIRAAVLALADRRRAAPAGAVTSVAAADPYLDVVQPLLELRCGTCHNDEKRNGGFSVGSYDSTLVGGDTGRAVVPGNVEASELLYRVGLPPDDEAFMPAEGKTPLTAQQVEILNWWVGGGRAARHDASARSACRPTSSRCSRPSSVSVGASSVAAPRRPVSRQRPMPSSSRDLAAAGLHRAAGLAERRAARREPELAGHAARGAGARSARGRGRRDRRPESRGHGARRRGFASDRRAARSDAPAPRAQRAHGRRAGRHSRRRRSSST